MSPAPACLLPGPLQVKLAESEWFVTGLVEPSLFSDNFSFADDTVATKGIKSYATGVRSLFDQVRGLGGRYSAGGEGRVAFCLRTKTSCHL